MMNEDGKTGRREWNTAPTEPLPLRETLPAISADTARRLIAFALNQPAVMPWLLMRSAAYWDRQKDPLEPAALDPMCLALDATCALDLLEWQCGQRGKEAIGWLKGMDEAAPCNPSTLQPINPQPC